jgi:hypothetical protein
MTEAALVWISSEEMFAKVSMKTAIRAVQRDLQAGLDPAQDFNRSILDVEHGQLLYMPSQFGAFVGAKVSTVAPKNAAIGKERIQGIYLLMDAKTLSPIMLMDGHALTALRTPAVSAAVADYLAPPRVDHLLVFGSGTQAWGQSVESPSWLETRNVALRSLTELQPVGWKLASAPPVMCATLRLSSVPRPRARLSSTAGWFRTTRSRWL